MITLQVLCCLLLIIKCESARILAVFPTPSYSHHEVFRQVSRALAERGHEVVVITPYPTFTKVTPYNLTEIDVHDVSQNVVKHVMKEFEKAGGDVMTLRKLCINASTLLFQAQFETQQVKNLLRDNKQFDLIIAEAINRPMVVLSWVYNAPVIQISSFGGNVGTFELVGAITHPLLFPSETRQKFKNLTYWEKLKELYNYYILLTEYYNVEAAENEMLKRYFGPDTPNLSELMNNIVLVFLNVHPLWDSNRPVPPNVIYLGTVSANPQGNMTKELQSYLDNSVRGIVYASFGTNVDEIALTSEKLEMIMNVFSKLPYDFLMKWDDEDIHVSKNIKISKWFPQVDVLRHPKVKLFITQGGLQSTYEAIAAGVPMIGIPMLFEQWLNVELCVQFKIAEQLDIDSIDKNILKNTIEKVMENQRYRENIAKLRERMLDQPEKPMERAIWWTEFVLRHGKDANMRPPSASMNWIEYYEVELVCLVVVSISAFFVVIWKLLRLFLKFMFAKKMKND